jgi:hypothetical protein
MPATHVPKRPLSVISESGCSESDYSEASPRIKSSALSTTNSSPSARLGMADFSSFLVSASEMDVETAIKLLREIKKHASPADLAALHQALEPERRSAVVDASKLTRSSNCSTVQGCICGLSQTPGSQPVTTRLSSPPRLGSLMCDEKTWAGREFLRTLTALQERSTSPHPECLRIVPPTPDSVPDSIESRLEDVQSERSDSTRPSGKTSRKPSSATSASKHSPTTPQHPKRSDSLSPPPTGDSGYSSGSSGRSSSWNQYKAASGWGLATRCESPLKMETPEQKSLRRYVAFNASFDSLTGSNYAGNRGSVTAVKLQSISSHQAPIVQKRLQKRRPHTITQGTKQDDAETPRTNFARRFFNPSTSSTPILPTEDFRELVMLAQAAAEANKSRVKNKSPQPYSMNVTRVNNKTPHPSSQVVSRVNNKTPHPSRQVVSRINNKTPHHSRQDARQIVRQIAELEADRPSRPRSLSLFDDRSTGYKEDITQLHELEADQPSIIFTRARSCSLPRRRSQLVELEADRPPTPPPRSEKRRSSLFSRRSASYQLEITPPDARLFAELEAHRCPLTAPIEMQSRNRNRSSSPGFTRTNKERSVAHHVSIADLGATANSLGSILYDMTVTGVIPDNNLLKQGASSKQDVPSTQDSSSTQDAPSTEETSPAQTLETLQPRRYSQHGGLRCKSLDDLKASATRPQLAAEPPSLPLIDTAKYSSDTKSLAHRAFALERIAGVPTTNTNKGLLEQITDNPWSVSTETSSAITTQVASSPLAEPANAVGRSLPTTPSRRPREHTPMPVTPTTPSRQVSRKHIDTQILLLVERFELADTQMPAAVVVPEGGLHRNASMPTMRQRA